MISQCPKCFTRGYELQENGLCHLCNYRIKANQQSIQDLEAILQQHMNNFNEKTWRSFDFGKAILGQILVDTIKRLKYE